MPETALITGASGGIGAELARVHAATGGDLVLVARSEDKLKQIKVDLEREFDVFVRVIAVDLSEPEAAEQVFAATKAAGLSIAILINNAGVGGHGKFVERELHREQTMMQLNIGTLVSLTHLYLEPMVQQGFGRVLNIASSAGFIPGPLQAVYYASKAFVLSFSQSLSEELSGTGVTVTALCPGPVKTGFAKASGLEDVTVFQFGASAKSVAKYGYASMQKGKLVAVNNVILGFLLRWIIPLMPRKVLLMFSRLSLEKPQK
ncbi:MAG: SDR family oxidoreductase [Halioglobus sp.]|nr:SDR family oxidoreductase [Halioglobus sp.]